MPDYEIVYLSTNDRPALIYRILRRDDCDAIDTATASLGLPYKMFEIWHGERCVIRGVNPLAPN